MGDTIHDDTQPTASIEGHVTPGDGFVPLTGSPANLSAVALIEAQAARRPDHIALKQDGRVITYGRFNQQANAVAHGLLALPHGDPALVALVMEHNPEKIIAMSGALKAGMAYAMLNSALGDDDLGELLDHSGARLVVVDRAHHGRVARLVSPGCMVLPIEALLATADRGNPGIATTPRTLSSISYTSGSTGSPKAVARNLGHEMLCIRAMHNMAGLGPEDVVAQLQNLWFTHVFAALIAGATLVLFDLLHGNFSDLGRLLREEAITYYGGMATGFLQFLRTLEDGARFPAMRAVELTGEPVGGEDLALFRRAFAPHCTLIASYTSSEQARMTSLVIDPSARLAPDAVLPVGRAAQDITVSLVDEALRPVPEGEIGEIVVASAFPSLGYWRDPERTAATWVRAPGEDHLLYLTGDMDRQDATGFMQIVGRKDDQIKIRGRLFFSS